jgi:hypothetical protein
MEVRVPLSTPNASTVSPSPGGLARCCLRSVAETTLNARCHHRAHETTIQRAKGPMFQLSSKNRVSSILAHRITESLHLWIFASKGAMFVVSLDLRVKRPNGSWAAVPPY